MAQVLPALRRVLDGDAVPDGLGEQDLLELHRRMVLLRTFDERAVAYHRQGRVGTYAISWNHEAIQAGATYALRDEDWIFPSYREPAIGLVRGLPPQVVLQWWRGHPSG
jgi:pyruvate dehydrogenase E1 component alpha subunit